ncbi:MAG TPA: exodeoxyribonuclease VII small subunit [Desulfomonilia bacterium]
MKKKTYSEILRELEALVEKMNSGDIPVDRLAETVKSASEMIKTLKKSLKSTEVEIAEILKSIDDGSPFSE